MFLTRAKYNDLVEKFQKKMLRLKVKCHTPFEFKTKLNYLFAQTEIRFNRHAEIQRVLKVIKLEYSKPTCPEDTDSQDDLFVVAVQEIDQNSETKSDKVNDQLVNWANHCQVVHQQFLMAGSPSGSDTTDRTIKSNDPSQPTDSMTSRSFDSNSSWTSKTNTNEHHRKDR